MKLNPDCIRDVLLYLEENLTYKNNSISMEHKEIPIAIVVSNVSENNKHSSEDVQYSIEKLFEINYIKIKNISYDKNKYIVSGNIYDITYEGHNFLNNIRPKNIWEATKSGASKLGLMSVHALSTISMKIVEKVVTDPVVIKKIIENIQ